MLKIEKINIDFEGYEALKDIDMEVEKGKVTALIGPNGAGKTTLFNIIAGVHKPSSGRVIFEGEDITGKKPYEICTLGITRTYQIIKLFTKMSVIDNVLVGMHTRNRTSVFDDFFHTKKMREMEKRSREKACRLLEQFGLLKYKDITAGNLSYGQQRVLEITRALASDPKLILLDEPAAGMNASEKVELNERIREIIGMGVTVLLVEHDMSLVMNIADKIYVLDAGTNLANGTPEQIANSKEVIEAYLGRGDN